MNAQELEKLFELKQKGLISAEEYDKLKSDILKDASFGKETAIVQNSSQPAQPSGVIMQQVVIQTPSGKKHSRWLASVSRYVRRPPVLYGKLGDRRCVPVHMGTFRHWLAGGSYLYSLRHLHGRKRQSSGMIPAMKKPLFSGAFDYHSLSSSINF